MPATKLLYIVIDGAADSLSSPRRALEEAHKPNMDSLARSCLSGMLYTVGRGIAPESDVAVLSLLGYEPSKYYTGRGPLEALGAGVKWSRGEVVFRANFSTVDPRTLRILDRRVGRSLGDREARALAESIKSVELDGGRARAHFTHTIAHRGVLVLSYPGKTLSPNVSNTDPAYSRRGAYSVALQEYEPYVAKAEPLDSSEESRLTARLVNEFTARAIEALDGHPVNRARLARGLPKANAVLLRDAGDRLPPAEPFEEKHGISMASVVEMVVERGIARALGLKDIEVRGAYEGRDSLYRAEAELAARALEAFDGVYVHLKGPDEAGHDGDLEGKVKAIEEIDRWFFSTLLSRIEAEDTLIILTADHATPWDVRGHSPDPVPIIFSNPALPEDVRMFAEKPSSKGGLGVIEGGFKVLPLARSIMARASPRP